MANITVTTNITIPVGGSIRYRYRRVSGGSWSAWLQSLTNPFTFSTADPIGTNYEIQVYTDCGGDSVSSTTTYTTGFTCGCNVSAITNLLVGPCDPFTNTHYIMFDVTYSCLRNDLNQITSVLRVQVGTNVYYINPTLASGTQSITISGINSDGQSKTLSVTCIAS